VWARRFGVALINMLHIAFGTVFVLGPFAWSACTFSTLMFGREDWELAIRTMRRQHRARTVVFDPRSGAALWLCRVLARVDRFELLRFEEGEVAGLEIVRPDGARLTGASALCDVVAALPLGPVVSWIGRVPGPRQLFDALLAESARGRASRFLGLSSKPERSSKGPSPLRRRLGLVSVGLREVAAVVMFAGAVNQGMVELWVINKRVQVPQPAPLRALAQKLRFLQGWFMFSPNPTYDDGTLVVDALTIDGRHVDPFWGEEPNLDLLHARSFGYSQIWSDYFNRMHMPGNSYYREAMKEYLLRLPERTGNPNDAIVSGDVYWVQDMNPKWGETSSYQEERNVLFSFQNPKHPKPPARD
jgi:hypothetical protein